MSRDCPLCGERVTVADVLTRQTRRVESLEAVVHARCFDGLILPALAALETNARDCRNSPGH